MLATHVEREREVDSHKAVSLRTMDSEERGRGGGRAQREWLRLAYRPNFGISTVVLFLERALSRRKAVSRAPSPCWKKKFNLQTSNGKLICWESD